MGSLGLGTEMRKFTHSKLELKDVKVSTILPLEKTEHPVLMEPSLYDVLFIDGYVGIVFFYRVQKNTPADHIAFIERLKLSLSKLLVPFYNMAGRWVKTYDATLRRLCCNDEGVPFIDAFIDEDLDVVVGLSKSQDKHGFEPCRLLSGFELLGLDSSKFQQISDAPLPSLFVQVTRFKCGSISVCATFSHMTADGRSMMDFLIAWSEESRRRETTIVPCHDKSRANISIWDFWPPLKEPSLNASSPRRVDLGADLRFPETNPLTSRFYSVKRSTIDRLKAEAAATIDMRLSTLDCLQAHIWQSIANLPASIMGKNSSETAVGTMIDGRKRCCDGQPLPDCYSSNFSFACLFPVVKDATELSSFQTAARLVHECVQGVTPSTFRGVIGNSLQFLGNWSSWKGRHLIITSWHRFPLYDIDFGCGNPFLAGLNCGFDFLPSGVCLVHPTPPGSDFVAVLQFAVCAEVQQALAADEKFLSIFT